ncbi:putative bifunctional diguanylate cyclase/phosphodiesterase [Ancylobacter amanitiformis]|uniref:Diguanylate cyclase (GGDEF)-like protein n=1 Tax=Ancylobacter amanitiformis TaxID=217069 RepID=A0ABU0LPC9_9HYPH|nr:EAL domain-containing protein [Ancylobacter amanitiformis]MDQ0510561.1 diguanylate cyclase (GGDEF)-like protein [Ancylobacter amanitiformis]
MKPAVRDILVLGLIGIVAYGIALYFGLHETLHAVFGRSESWHADELIVAIQIMALCGFAYGVMRLKDLHAEVARRGAAEAKAEYLAFHDLLTDLPNRHFVEQRLPSLCRARRLRSFFLVDLDNFKRVNDVAGHRGGDATLRTITRRLSAELPLAVIARMGGDEFLVALPVGAPEQAQALAERIREVINGPITFSGMTLHVTACIGFTTLAAADDLKDAVTCADLALHEAKRNGPASCCAYTPELRRELAARLATESRLREAVAADRIDVHFQPLVRLTDGSIHGFEALARWKLEDGSSVPPDVFIPIAEEAGLISDLSTHLLRRACRTALTWPSGLILAFNISPLQLVDILLPERILAVLAETGFPAHRLSVEITESGFAADLERALDIIGRLREQGVRIAIDDFGTGYSSLSQLANFPVDKLKIDRQFIANFLTSDKQMKIVRAIVQIGLGLGIATLAEGVETEEEHRRLRALGCQLGQGYLFAAPMPADEVATYLAGLSDPGAP